MGRAFFRGFQVVKEHVDNPNSLVEVGSARIEGMTSYLTAIATFVADIFILLDS